MPSHIYRFEILSNTCDRDGNRVYEANDPLTTLPVQLYEWRPQPGKEKAVAERLGLLQPELTDAETFSSGSLVYLAVSAELAKTTLEQLRRNELFTGPWPDLVDELVLPPVTTNAVASPASLPTEPPSKIAWILFTITAVVCLILLMVLADANSRYSSLSGSVSQSQSRLAELQNKIASQIGQIDALNTKVSKAEADLMEIESLSFNAIYSVYDKAEDALGTPLLPFPTLTSECTGETLSVALSYQSRLGQMVSIGWYELTPSKPSMMVPSKDGSFLFAARSKTSDKKWGGMEKVDGADANFFHLGKDRVVGNQKLLLLMKKAQGSWKLTCN